MTRIVYVCADPGIAYGGTKGASVHVAELTTALAGEGADILLAVTRIDPDAPPPPPGVELTLLAGPARTPVDVKERADADAARAEWLAHRAREWGAAMLYERMALHAEAGGIAARAAGIPHVVELNAPLPEEAARYRRLEDPARACDAEGRVLRAADAVLAVSRPLAYYARRRGAGRVDVVPNAVDPARFPLGADAERQPPTAVFAGSLRPWHGARVLADAWRMLGRDAPRLLVVGDGDGRAALTAAGAEVTGRVPPSAVPALLAGAQIGLCPYPADAPDYFSPIKLFEYLAAGLPVVAADLPGVMDVAGDVAVCVPAGDAAAFADAVAELAADPNRRAKLGAEGRRLTITAHTWSHRARGVLALATDDHRLPARI